MRTLDILITGKHRYDFEEKLEHLTSRYDSLNIHCIGNPHEGIHDDIVNYASRNICPLTLGTAKDAETILRRLRHADHAAVLIFGESGNTEEIQAAEWIKRQGSFQTRYIA